MVRQVVSYKPQNRKNIKSAIAEIQTKRKEKKVKKLLVLMLVALVASTVVFALTAHKYAPVRATGNEQPVNTVFAKGTPKNPSPGDTVGMTSFDWTHNGGMGKHLGIDNAGGLHFHYTYRDLAGSAASRMATYNYRDAAGAWMGSVPLTGNAGSRWGTGTCAPTNAVGVGTCYYTAGANYPVQVGVDGGTGLGLFTVTVVDNNAAYAHPYIAMVGDDTIYLAADGDVDDVMFAYSYDAGASWTGWTNIGDPVNYPINFPQYNIAAWHNKVAYVNVDTFNNIFIRESADYGQTWGAIQTILVPGNNNGPDGDTLIPYIHSSCMYDAAGNLHVFDAYYSYGKDYQGIVHWSQAGGITYVNRNQTGDTVRQIGGQNTLLLSYPYATQLANGDMVCQYSRFDTLDIAANTYADGDIWASVSTDNGVTWTRHTNITNSRTPGAASGACADDRYGVVEAYGDTLHFFWLSSQNAYSSLYVDLPTMDPLLHLAVAEVDIDGVAGKPYIPVARTNFALRKAYPNPASSRATIAFALPKAGAYSLNVYNITGQLVKSINGQGNVGLNNVTLNTKDLANGVLFYQLKAGANSATGKLTVVR